MTSIKTLISSYCTKRRIRYLFFILLALTAISVSIHWTSLGSKKKQAPVILKGPVVSYINVDNKKGPSCRPPLEPWNKDAVRYNEKIFVDCGKEGNPNSTFFGIAFELRNGNELWQVVNMGLTCCYRPFSRDGDDNVKIDEDTCIQIEANVTLIPTTIEYIEVVCLDKNNSQRYRDAFAIAHDNLKPPVQDTDNPSANNSPKLHFAVVVLDSMSRLNLIRKMPVSNDYLLNTLGAIPLYGYSILQSSTIDNVNPLLTGLTLNEVRNVCEGLDECPFIYKEFSKRGYITSHADDWAIYYYDLGHGFKYAPTDYYFRPAWVRMRGTKHYYNCVPLHQYCFGPRLTVEAILNFMDMVREKADKLNRPSFQFSLTGNLAHNCWFTAEMADFPLFQTLVKLKETGRLNNTVFILLGDHGYSSGGPYLRKSAKGREEYRYPLAYLVFPEWFKVRYPEEHKNLLANSWRMTTSYDMYETIMDLMELGQRKKSLAERNNPGKSLLTPIPENRTCQDAGILLRWCRVCYPELGLKRTDPVVLRAAEMIVEQVNRVIKDRTRECAEQKLGGVIGAAKWDQRDVMDKICSGTGGKATVQGGKHLQLSCEKEGDGVNVMVYNVQLTTLSVVRNGTGYQAHVIITNGGGYNYNRSSEYLVVDEVKRLDEYGKSGSCMANKYLQQYCLCA